MDALWNFIQDNMDEFGLVLAIISVVLGALSSNIRSFVRRRWRIIIIVALHATWVSFVIGLLYSSALQAIVNQHVARSLHVVLAIATIAELVLLPIYFMQLRRRKARQSRSSISPPVLLENRLVSVAHNTALDRVLRHGTLRCAYTVYPPFSAPSTTFEVEPIGIAVDILGAIAETTGIKIKWERKSTWSDMIAGLDANKYDLVSYVWQTAGRRAAATFLVPFYSSRVAIYARASDARFDGVTDLKDIINIANKQSCKFAVIPGELSEDIARYFLPKARHVSLPADNTQIELLTNLRDKESALAFMEPYVAIPFCNANPGSIKKLTSDSPFIVPGSFMVKRGEFGLRDILNLVLMQLYREGVIKEKIETHEKDSGGPEIWNYEPGKRGVLV